MELKYYTVLFLVPYLSSVYAATSSLVLSTPSSVTSGASVTYNCTSEGNGVDPTLEWNIRDASTGSVIRSNSQLSSQVVGGTTNANDGVIKSSVTFTVTSEFISQRLWCYAIDSGSTTASRSIFTTISTTNQASLGGTCSTTVTCASVNAGCVSNVCTCNNGYYDTNGPFTAGGSCSQTVGLGETCTAGIDASCYTTNAVCSATSPYRCECGSNFQQSGTSCVISSATYGQSCTNPTRTCSALNTECISGSCQCNSGYTYSSSLGYCVTSTALVGQSCVNPTRACITNAACSGGTCACSSGYYQASTSSCVLPIVGQACTTSVGCAANSGTTTATPQCSNSVCVCPSNYYATSGVCYIRASVGGSCNTAASTPCSDSNSACTGSPTTCQCNSGYTNTNGNCVQSSSTSLCPFGTSSSSTVTGSTSPSTPSVTVGQTCYEVNLSSTVLMTCKDSKGTSSLQSARWIKLPDTQIQQTTGRFINGDIANPNLTISNAESSDAGNYICQLCYGSSYTACTNSSSIQLIVIGSAITSSSASVSSTIPLRGTEVTFSCSTSPDGAATSYQWLLGSSVVSTSTSPSYTITTVGTSQSGSYRCIASNSYGSQTSNTVTIDVQFAPEPNGGTTITIEDDFANGDITITCNMNANPSITAYSFYDSSDTQLQNSSSNTYTVTSTQGYQTYSCRAQNSRGLSGYQYLQVVEPSDPAIGAATENTGIGTGTIAAIVLGIIFLLLLIIIIIVCCCSYGWCRKKEKVEPQVIIEKPVAKPYIPRTIVSATSTVSRKDVGIMVNGYRDASVSTEFEEPRYTTPRYHLKRDTNGPIISMYDNGYEQPRAHQLPALDTQYLYPDNEPRKHKKKKRRRRRHEDVSPRRHDYEPEPEPDVRYAETMPASDEDLVVIPGKQNYFE